MSRYLLKRFPIYTATGVYLAAAPVDIVQLFRANGKQRQAWVLAIIKDATRKRPDMVQIQRLHKNQWTIWQGHCHEQDRYRFVIGMFELCTNTGGISHTTHYL